MTITADSKSPETQTGSFINDEFLAGVDKDPDRLLDLSEDQQAEFHTFIMNEAEGENQEPPVDTPDNPPEPTPETPPDPKPEDVPEQKDDEPAEQELETVKKEVEKEKAEHQKIADELNKIRQKRNSMAKALEKEKTQQDELKQKVYNVNDDDIYDPKSLKEMMIQNKRLEDRLALMESNQNQNGQAGVDAAAKLEEELRQRRIFSEIDDLQTSFPALATKVPFRTLDAEWGAYLDTIVKLSEVTVESLALSDEQKADPGTVRQALRNKAYANYEIDPVLQESAKKFLSPSFQDEANLKNYHRILDLNEQKGKNGGTLKMNFWNHLDEKGLLEKHITEGKRDAAIKASNDTAGAIENNSPSPIIPTDGPAESPSGSIQMTVASATQRMNLLQQKLENGHQWTPSEVQEQNEVISFLEKQKGE